MTRDTNLRDMLHRAAKWFPNNEAVVDDLYRYTYAELKDKVQRMAKLLHTRGVRKGDRVALLMYPSVQHVVALFGAFELGDVFKHALVAFADDFAGLFDGFFVQDFGANFEFEAAAPEGVCGGGCLRPLGFGSV